MKNPDSYQHAETRFADKGDHLVVIMKFRGTNSFGGVVPNTVIAKCSFTGKVLQIINWD